MNENKKANALVNAEEVKAQAESKATAVQTEAEAETKPEAKATGKPDRIEPVKSKFDTLDSTNEANNYMEALNKKVFSTLAQTVKKTWSKKDQAEFVTEMLTNSLLKKIPFSNKALKLVREHSINFYFDESYKALKIQLKNGKVNYGLKGFTSPGGVAFSASDLRDAVGEQLFNEWFETSKEFTHELIFKRGEILKEWENALLNDIETKYAEVMAHPIAGMIDYVNYFFNVKLTKEQALFFGQMTLKGNYKTGLAGALQPKPFYAMILTLLVTAANIQNKLDEIQYKKATFKSLTSKMVIVPHNCDFEKLTNNQINAFLNNNRNAIKQKYGDSIGQDLTADSNRTLALEWIKENAIYQPAFMVSDEMKKAQEKILRMKEADASANGTSVRYHLTEAEKQARQAKLKAEKTAKKRDEMTAQQLIASFIANGLSDLEAITEAQKVLQKREELKKAKEQKEPQQTEQASGSKAKAE